MEKDLEFIELFEVYKGLLTGVQVKAFESHFCLDLSLNEVAEELNTTRQSVNDAIKKVKAKLTEYESKLHLKEKNDLLNKLLEKTEDENLRNDIKGIIEI